MKRWLRTLAIACMTTAVFLFPPTLLWLPWLAPQEALAESIWGDDLVSFEFSSPATRVVLDGEPLAILPETLAVDVSYYDAEGQLVERTIPYDYDKGGSNAQWNDKDAADKRLWRQAHDRRCCSAPRRPRGGSQTHSSWPHSHEGW